MIETMREIWEQIVLYNQNSIMLSLFAIAFLYLMLFDSEFRKRLGWPMLFMLFLVLNPILYAKVWIVITHTIGWRLFWLFDEVFIIAYALTVIFGRIQNRTIRFGMLVVFLCMIVYFGDYTYSKERFDKADNFYKIPQECNDITDYLLAIEDPCCAVYPMPYYIYARQYSNHLKLLYGRDISGYTTQIWDGNIVKVYKELKKGKPDGELITRLCREHNVRFIVVKKKKKYKCLIEYGFIPIKEFENYFVYADERRQGD